MNADLQQYHDEIATTGRIAALAGAISTAIAKGMKRSADERRCLWQQIADEATRCRDGIPLGGKAKVGKSSKVVAVENEMKAFCGNSSGDCQPGER